MTTAFTEPPTARFERFKCRTCGQSFVGDAIKGSLQDLERYCLEAKDLVRVHHCTRWPHETALGVGVFLGLSAFMTL